MLPYSNIRFYFSTSSLIQNDFNEKWKINKYILFGKYNDTGVKERAI